MKTAILVIERPDSGNISVKMFADNENKEAEEHFANIARENGFKDGENEGEIEDLLGNGYAEQGTWEFVLDPRLLKNMKKLWTQKLRDVYDNDFERFKSYCLTYGIHSRLGFETMAQAWEKNPTIQGSTNPNDLRIKP